MLAISIFTRRSGRNIFLHATKALDVLARSWKDIIVSLSTDGERQRIACVHDLAVLYEQAASRHFHLFWCGPQQFDIKLQPSFVFLRTESSTRVLRRWSSTYSGSRTRDANTKAPIVVNIRWESTTEILSRLEKTFVEVLTYLNQKKPSFAPMSLWWFKYMFLQKISAETI